MNAQAPTYSRSDLTREISRHYGSVRNQRVISPTDLATAVLSGWPKTKIRQDKWCRTELVYESVQRFFRAIKRKEEEGEDENQGELPHVEIRPGHTRLQRAYATERCGDLAIVQLEYMTSTERQGKAHAMQKNAAGLMEHADEIMRYDRENPNQ